MNISHFESAFYAQIYFDRYLTEDVGYGSSSFIIIFDPEFLARFGAYLSVHKQKDFVKGKLLVVYDDSVFPTEFVWTFKCQVLTTKFFFNSLKEISNQDEMDGPPRTLMLGRQ